MAPVRSGKAGSGVVFTLDTESGFRDVVAVSGAYGLAKCRGILQSIVAEPRRAFRRARHSAVVNGKVFL